MKENFLDLQEPYSKTRNIIHHSTHPYSLVSTSFLIKLIAFVMLLIINAFVIKLLASSGEYRRPRGLGLCRGFVLKATKWFFRNKADGLLCQSSG